MTKGQRLERLKSKDSVLWWWSQKKHSASAYAWQGSHLLYLLAFHIAGPFVCADNHHIQHTRIFWLTRSKVTIPTPTKLIYWFPPTGDRLA